MQASVDDTRLTEHCSTPDRSVLCSSPKVHRRSWLLSVCPQPPPCFWRQPDAATLYGSSKKYAYPGSRRSSLAKMQEAPARPDSLPTCDAPVLGKTVRATAQSWALLPMPTSCYLRPAVAGVSCSLSMPTTVPAAGCRCPESSTHLLRFR